MQILFQIPLSSCRGRFRHHRHIPQWRAGFFWQKLAFFCILKGNSDFLKRNIAFFKSLTAFAFWRKGRLSGKMRARNKKRLGGCQMAAKKAQRKKKDGLIKDIARNKFSYLIALPAMVYVFIFSYCAYPYMLLAFQRYDYRTSCRER